MKRIYIKWVLLSFLLILLQQFTYYLLNIRQLTYNSYVEKLTNEQINQIFDIQDKWRIVGYFFVFILLLIKTLLITGVLQMGSFFYDENSIPFKQMWDIVLKTEYVFLPVPILKLIWFYFFQTNYNFQDVLYFYPLSALNIVSYKDLYLWYIYPIQTFNLFELLYIIYLGHQISNITKTNFDKGISLVLYTYVPFLVLWIAIVMFFTLNLS